MENIIRLPARNLDPTYFDLLARLQELESRITKHDFLHNRISIPTSSGTEIIPVSDIIHCNSDSNYCKIYLTDGTKILVAKTLKYIQECLPLGFFSRVHNSHLVNIAFIRKIETSPQKVLVLKDGTRIPYSRVFTPSSIF